MRLCQCLAISVGASVHSFAWRDRFRPRWCWRDNGCNWLARFIIRYLDKSIKYSAQNCYFKAVTSEMSLQNCCFKAIILKAIILKAIILKAIILKANRLQTMLLEIFRVYCHVLTTSIHKHQDQLWLNFLLFNFLSFDFKKIIAKFINGCDNNCTQNKNYKLHLPLFIYYLNDYLTPLEKEKRDFNKTLLSGVLN